MQWWNHLPKKKSEGVDGMLIAEIYAVTKIGPSIATKMKHSHSKPSKRKGMKEKECVMHNVIMNSGPMSTV